MKKLQSVLVLVLLVILSSSVFSSTKYDDILTLPGWKAAVIEYDKYVSTSYVLKEYFNLLVSKKDLIRISNSGVLNKEKSKFVVENLSQYLKVMHVVIAVDINDSGWKYTDQQMMYFIGLIKDPHAQLAKNGPEYEIEKQFWHGFPPYALWEKSRGPGFIEGIIDRQIDSLYKQVKK